MSKYPSTVLRGTAQSRDTVETFRTEPWEKPAFSKTRSSQNEFDSSSLDQPVDFIQQRRDFLDLINNYPVGEPVGNHFFKAVRLSGQSVEGRGLQEIDEQA